MTRQRIAERVDRHAREMRRDIVRMIAAGGSGHPGGSLSATDILATLYFEVMRIDPANPLLPDRDRFVLSKGHAAPALYAALAGRGFFPKEWLWTFSKDGSRLQKHPDMKLVPGVEISTGALGIGMSVAVGMALDARLRDGTWRVFAMIGDGECDEGQIWEAAMSAAHFGLDSLTVFLDLNGLQVDGSTSEVMRLSPIADKWRAFGWHVQEIDGHDVEAILDAIDVSRAATGQPSMIIAKTVKGRGISFVENRVEWHAGSFTPEQEAQALSELADGQADTPKPGSELSAEAGSDGAGRAR